MNNTVIQLILNAGYVVKAVLLILMTFSVISWAIIFYKQKYFTKARQGIRTVPARVPYQQGPQVTLSGNTKPDAQPHCKCIQGSLC